MRLALDEIDAVFDVKLQAFHTMLKGKPHKKDVHKSARERRV